MIGRVVLRPQWLQVEQGGDQVMGNKEVVRDKSTIGHTAEITGLPHRLHLD